jgi:hypothetical protein
MESETAGDAGRIASAVELHARPPRAGLAPGRVSARTRRPASGPRAAARLTAARPRPAQIQLTARGSVLGLFITCFLAMVIAGWTGWSAVADLAFVVAGGAAALYTKRGALLALTVSPPVIFLAACVCAELLTASGTFATATGIFATLGTSAPWLYAGTAVILVVALCRGVSDEIGDLVADVRGEPR